MSSPKPRRWLRRPGHATVIAYLALFAALGTGGAWAAATVGSSDIKNDAIKSHHIANGQVKAKDVGIGQVGSAKIADDSTPRALKGVDIANESLTGADVQNGSLSNADTDSSVQDSCTGGAVAGHVYVKGSGTFSSSYTSTNPPLQDQFNCTGGATKVQVKRTATGTYSIDFPGIDPASHLVATGNVTVESGGTQDTNDMVTYKLVFDSSLGRTVYRVVTANGSGTAEDREFSFSVDG